MVVTCDGVGSPAPGVTVTVTHGCGVSVAEPVGVGEAVPPPPASVPLPAPRMITDKPNPAANSTTMPTITSTIEMAGLRRRRWLRLCRGPGAGVLIRSGCLPPEVVNSRLSLGRLTA